MSEQGFLDAMGELDASFVEEAVCYHPRAEKHWSRWAIPLAACLALAVLAFPVYRMREPAAPAVHSYVVAGNGAGENQNTTADAGGDESEGGIGDRDADMSPDELTRVMLDAGCTQAEIDEYRSIGYRMTWAKWWKFVGEQQNSEGDAPFDLERLKVFSQRELDVGGGAPIGNEAGAAAQAEGVTEQAEGVTAYENLMAYFTATCGPDQYPEWYGGSYINRSGTLTINVVGNETGGADDKAFYLQIMEWAGSQQVVFADAKYSLTFLRDLQKQVEALPALAAVSSWACGANEESGQVELTIPYADEALLMELARLDPADDAILVQVGGVFNTGTGLPEKLPEAEKKAD